jgi:S1 RNA binding domain protein
VQPSVAGWYKKSPACEIAGGPLLEGGEPSVREYKPQHFKEGEEDFVSGIEVARIVPNPAMLPGCRTKKLPPGSCCLAGRLRSLSGNGYPLLHGRRRRCLSLFMHCAKTVPDSAVGYPLTNRQSCSYTVAGRRQSPDPMTIEPGAIVTGTVVKIADFGAIVRLGGGKSGLIHISEIADTFVRDVRDFLAEEDEVTVKVLRVNNRGRLELSLKQCDAKPSPRPDSRQLAAAGSQAASRQRAGPPQTLPPPRPRHFRGQTLALHEGQRAAATRPQASSGLKARAQISARTFSWRRLQWLTAGHVY